MNDIKALDKAGLYEVRSFTDTIVGDLRVLIPITAQGREDLRRLTRFFSSITLQVGPQMIPTGFEIEGAKSLEEAIDMMPAAAKAAGEAFAARLESQQMQQRLVMPGRAPTRQ